MMSNALAENIPAALYTAILTSLARAQDLAAYACSGAALGDETAPESARTLLVKQECPTNMFAMAA